MDHTGLTGQGVLPELVCRQRERERGESSEIVYTWRWRISGSWLGLVGKPRAELELFSMTDLWDYLSPELRVILCL